jgi:hypothetical protein
MITVTLLPYEHEYAATVGVRRFNERRDSKDAVWYDPERMEPNLQAAIATCVCELGVAKALNKYWGGHVWHEADHDKYKRGADVGRRIEVRRVREINTPPAIRYQDVERGRIVVAAYTKPPLYVEVQVLGWIEAMHGWNLGAPAGYDKSNRTRTLAPAYWRDLKNFTE